MVLVTIYICCRGSLAEMSGDLEKKFEAKKVVDQIDADETDEKWKSICRKDYKSIWERELDKSWSSGEGEG